eukprot:TRINITY_DN10042_c0_g1_i7.p1 TRINITY_DN10042_c0_g1~~TRINITY_DN10042_c0_g1_i7.p1  ORF type:complete len:123 (-),score=66.63 TRINITY_DN10042_c0_g1_i7:35-403(-)
MIFFFFFKQKTAYEMLRSLVGSEMCIRDSTKKKHTVGLRNHGELAVFVSFSSAAHCSAWMELLVNSMPPVEHLKSQVDQYVCLLYTSDAADEEDSGDLGGRRIIKKKKKLKEAGAYTCDYIH